MTTATGAPGTGWKITGQRQTQQLPAGGQAFVQGVEVTFSTQHGVVGSVFEPYATYSPDRVTADVSALAAQLDAVSGLTG